VDVRGAGGTRRWQLAIAIIAALGMFVVVVTAWAGRGSVLAPKTPAPSVASAQTNPATLISHTEHGILSSSLPAHQKPTKNGWMTRERPPRWQHLTPNSVWSVLPASFAAPGFQPDGAHPGAPPACLAGRDILTRFCLSRR
jgi:hypothetical protein